MYQISDGVQDASGAFTTLISTGGHTTAVELARHISERDNITTYVWDRTAFTLCRLFASVSSDGSVSYPERSY